MAVRQSGQDNLSAARPLSAWLSQVLVAFTLEFDNEFERRMSEAGYPGALLSLVVWCNLIRFLPADDISVHDLAVQASAPTQRIECELGCLERWGFLRLRADPSDDRAIPTRSHRQAGRVLREGWGSGRGIRSGWRVSLTEKGRKAAGIWPTLFGEIERRWQARFGHDEITNLRQALGDVVTQLDVELPEGLPGHWEANEAYPSLGGHHTLPRALPVLLSQLLFAFTIEFDRKSRAPLILCANTLRVLGEVPIPVSDLPRLTGGSPETSGIGWQMKPYVMVEGDPSAKRGKVVRLSSAGLKAQRMYGELVAEIEQRWEARFGKEKIRRIRLGLRELFVPRGGDRLVLAEGLVPAQGTVRSGEQQPALGRRNVGVAARRRMRDLVIQTERFLRDPVNSLPHYPMWDMNRGFGP